MATFFLSYPMLSAFWLQQVLKLPSGYQPNFSNNIGLQETKYPLVNSHITMGHHHVINGKIKYFDCSSQTVSHYQRVSPLYSHFLKDQQSPCFVKKIAAFVNSIDIGSRRNQDLHLDSWPARFIPFMGISWNIIIHIYITYITIYIRSILIVYLSFICVF